jgi:hypothetical protein
MNPREARTLLPPPPECLQCAHVIGWSGINGRHHDCLRGLPMHPDCPWHSHKTDSIMQPKEA